MKPGHGQEGHPRPGMHTLCVLCALGVLAGAMEVTRAAPPKEPTGVISGIEFTTQTTHTFRLINILLNCLEIYSLTY